MSLQENKIIQRAELYLTQKNTQGLILARHITNWDTYLKVCQDLAIGAKDRIYLDDIDMPAIGLQVKQWPEEIIPPPPPDIRKWTIAGTCMNRSDWYEALGQMKFTHLYHNRACGMDMDRLEQMGIKVIINYTGESEEEWKQTYSDWADENICGGHWLDDSGHEPDITRHGESYENWKHRLEVRERFYKFIRTRDPDVFRHPVMEMMDNTATGDFPNEHPGWKIAFSEATHDLLLVDIYPDKPNIAEMLVAMERSWNKFIKVYPHEHQVIIQMCAYGNSYWPGYIVTQYDYWKTKMASVEFENPYRGPIGVCFYKQETMMHSKGMQREIQAVNEEVKGG